jgi:putative transposase
MVSPSSRRRAVKLVVEEGLGSAVQACRAIGLARSSYYRPSLVSVESRRVRKEVLELSEKHPRYGYRRITTLLRRDGFSVNAKRVQRLRREEGIHVRKKTKANASSWTTAEGAATGNHAETSVELGFCGRSNREWDTFSNFDLDG